jgi:hypothetical protein
VIGLLIGQGFATVVIVSFAKYQSIAPCFTVPFLRNFHWGGKTGKKGRTKNMSRRGLANARV